MDVVKYIAWLLPTLLGFAGNWLFKFTEDDPNAPDQKRLTNPGRVAIVVALFSLLLAGYTTYADQRVAAEKAATAQADQQEMLQKLEEANDKLAKAVGRLNDNLEFLGAKAGQCSLKGSVKFNSKNGEISVRPASSVLVELESPRTALVWFCGESEKKTGWEKPFDVLRCDRTGSAVVWTFFKKVESGGT